MPRTPVSKLAPEVPRVPRGQGARGVPGTRRQQYSASTKRTLVDAAELLFTEQGYAATSLDQVVAGAEVTKGALYHHFSGKVALFEAVFERVADGASARVRRAVDAHDDPWEAAQAGLRVFLDVVQEERYRRVVILEGPAVLGRERYREQEERSTFATVVDLVAAMVGAGAWELDDATVQTFARIFFGAVVSAGEEVARSADEEAAAARVEGAIGFILAGFRILAEGDVPVPETLTRLRLVDPG